MFKVLNPLFNVDGASSGSWASFFESKASADDVQPIEDTEVEAINEDEAEEVEQDDTEVEEDEVSDEEQSEDTEESEEEVVEEDPEIEIGDGKKPVKMSELKNGYMRQSDYTKKTQELATQRKEVETLRESLRNAENWQAHLDRNPWLYQQINQAIQLFETTGVLPLEEALEDAQYGHYINHLMVENDRLQKELGAVKGEYEGVKLTSEISRLRNELQSDYGDLVTDSYMESLQERAKTEKLSVTTLKEIAEGHLAKQKLQSNTKNVKKVSKEAEARAIQKLQETRKQAPTAPKSTIGKTNTRKEISGREDWAQFLRRMSGE